MHTNRSVVKVGAVLAGLALVASACSSSGGSKPSDDGSGSGGSGAEKGVTAKSVTVGLITTETGLPAASFTGTVDAVKARIAAQNAEGGVGGRQIKLVVVDDQGTPTGNAAAAKQLASQDVFGVIDVTTDSYGGYKTLQQAGIPVTGFSVSPEWGVQPNTNMFEISSPVDPTYPEYDTLGTLMKDLGATKVGGISFSNNIAGNAQLNGMVAGALKAGLQKGYVNTSLVYGKLDATSAALSLKQSGTDGLYVPIDAGEIFQILGAAAQAGAKPKVAIMPSGYGQQLLDSAASASAAQGVYFVTAMTPVSVQTPGTKEFQEGLAKYAKYPATKIPEAGQYWGWISADLMIKGLETAGANLTRKSFIDGLHGVSDYDADGLLAQPSDYTLAHFGKAGPQLCEYVLQLQGKEFKPYPSDGKPVCGGLIKK